MNGIIYIFGPSCSGKSTLGKALQKQLGHEWTYLDRDLLIEEGQCLESAADKLLEEKIKALGKKVIVDTQIPWRAKNEEEVYCLILPPLQTLLERDSIRTERLHRSAQRALYAKQYVIDTYQALHEMPKERFDIRLDSSLLPVEETVAKVLQLAQVFKPGFFSS